MQLCVPDDSLHIFDVQPPREVKGRAAYRKDWEDAFNSVSGPLEVENSDMDVTSGGDIAYVHYINHVVGTTKDGKKANFTVRVTDCLKKINGVWLIAHSHVSVPVDMRTGEADLQSKP
jgi:ketosteroid isomerase-like protein